MILHSIAKKGAPAVQRRQDLRHELIDLCERAADLQVLHEPLVRPNDTLGRGLCRIDILLGGNHHAPDSTAF